MSEWPKEAVLKTVVPKGTVGSNPTPSAKKFDFLNFTFDVCCFSGVAERWPSWLKALAC
jgi:hypothetical protein